MCVLFCGEEVFSEHHDIQYNLKSAHVEDLSGLRFAISFADAKKLDLSADTADTKRIWVQALEAAIKCGRSTKEQAEESWFQGTNHMKQSGIATTTSASQAWGGIEDATMDAPDPGDVRQHLAVLVLVTSIPSASDVESKQTKLRAVLNVG